MLKIHFHRNIVWYDFSSIDINKLQEILNKNNINPYMGNKFIEVSNRNKVMTSFQNLFISIDIPFLEKDSFIKNNIKIILGKDYIITNIPNKCKGIKKFKNNFDNGSNFYRGQHQNSKVSDT